MFKLSEIPTNQQFAYLGTGEEPNDGEASYRKQWNQGDKELANNLSTSAFLIRIKVAPDAEFPSPAVDEQEQYRHSLAFWYLLQNQERVFLFLDDYSDLVPILLEAYPQIQEHFPDHQVCLEVVSDPEIPNSEYLRAYIQTKLDADEAFQRLKSFDRAWWLENFHVAQDKLLIDIAFL